MARSPDHLDARIGDRIRLLRKRVGVTQGALGEALGVTFQQIQKYEKGANRVSASRLNKIAARLDCSVRALLGEDGEADLHRVNPELLDRDAVQLLEAYAQLSPAHRAALLTLVIAIAGSNLAGPGP